MATAMSTTFGAGFHAAPGKTVDALAYDRWTGRWSRLFIAEVLAAAAVGPKCRVLVEQARPRGWRFPCSRSQLEHKIVA
jgi:hypothetical protein